MRAGVLGLIAAMTLHGVPVDAANLRVLERELALLDMGPESTPARGGLPAAERRLRLQEQTDAIRKAVEGSPRVVIVNIPAYTLTAYEDGEPVLESRVIVGAVDRKTPLTETDVSGVQFNPAWNAPPKVVKGDLTRNGMIDERAVRKKGLTVLDEKGNPLPPEVLSFVSAEQTGRLRYYHPPGDGNALGRLKVTLKGMPDIYLHDTPNRNLFAKSRRAMSSGCVRVEKARELAAWLTGKSRDEIEQLIDGRATRTVAVAPTKVVIGYWLSDTAGERAIFVDDVYKLAARRGETVVAAAKPAEKTGSDAASSTVPVPQATAVQPSPAELVPAGKRAERVEAAAARIAMAEPVAAAPAAGPATVPAAVAPAPADPVPSAAPTPPVASAGALPASVPVTPRRALLTPANAAPWVGHYVRSALAGLEMEALRHNVSWQLPVTGAPAMLTLTIDRNGYVRSADLEAVTAGPTLRTLARQHFERHPRTLPFPEPLARDVDEVVVPVPLTAVRG